MQSISIALCTFNGGRFLEEQMRSLRVQEGVGEIVVVDDGSSDDTLAILERHAAQDARIQIYRNPVRLGVTRNFQRALSLARSPWIALADQDDVWLPGKLRCLRAEWDGNACLVHHATHKFHGTAPAALPSPAGHRRKFFGAEPQRLLYRNSIVGHTILVRAKTVRSLMPFPPEVPYDWWIGVGAAASGLVQYVDEYLVHYRIHDANAYHPTGSRLRRLRDEHDLRLQLLQNLLKAGGLTEPQQEFVRDYHRLLRQSERGTFSWSLFRFYGRHAAFLFGAVRSPSPWFFKWRKSLTATLGAAIQVPQPTAAGKLYRPAVDRRLAAVESFEKTA